LKPTPTGLDVNLNGMFRQNIRKTCPSGKFPTA
jgi:hypothetical protein